MHLCMCLPCCHLKTLPVCSPAVPKHICPVHSLLPVLPWLPLPTGQHRSLLPWCPEPWGICLAQATSSAFFLSVLGTYQGPSGLWMCCPCSTLTCIFLVILTAHPLLFRDGVSPSVQAFSCWPVPVLSDLAFSSPHHPFRSLFRPCPLC